MSPLEKLRKANDDYHEAVAEIFLLEGTATKNKIEFAVAVKQVFEAFDAADAAAAKCTN
jgi:hypothetical protein